MGIRRFFFCSLLVVAGADICAAADQEALQKIKALYAAAAYEDVLAVITTLPSEARVQPIDQYRAFCLIALGQTKQAQEAIEALIAADPSYAPDPADISPRVVDVFNATRQRVLPAVTKRLYLEAKVALDRKDRDAAIARFQELLRVIDGASELSDFADLRVLASGFLDLSRALPAAAAAAPERAAAPAASPSSTTTAPASGTMAAPSAGTTTAPSAGTATPPSAGTTTAPSAGTATPPSSGTPTAPPAGTASAPASGMSTAAAPMTSTPPKALKQDLPPWTPYDGASRRGEFSGAIRVRVGPDGRVQSAEMLRRVHPAYDSVLLERAKTWLYQPARMNNAPIAADVVVEVRLQPQE
jgi:tetratricopeptide (TPR) repeat protein